ncbi:MAG: O-methyltransferase [Candidatus Acidiferrales bacterium]
MAGEILNAAVEDYLAQLLPRRDAVIMEMEKLARRESVPIVGPVVARLLALITEISGAKRIFELGSAIGYSTLWFARAAGPGAEVHYTDNNPENARRATEFLKRGGVLPRVRVHVGDALASLRKTRGKFDLIFCDLNKTQYPAALRMALPRLKLGGLLIADNTLWRGRVAHASRDETTRAIQKFNRMIYASKLLLPVIVPLRDGVAICRKR